MNAECFAYALAADPNNLALWLISADWLEEHGDTAEAERRRHPVAITLGIGIGIGSGSGIGRGIYTGGSMTVGKCYLVHCGDWHTFVGRCVQQLNQVLFEFADVSKIQDTHNGDNWDDLALGEDIELRRACDYRHYKTPVILPLALAAIEWNGRLPQEMEDRH